MGRWSTGAVTVNQCLQINVKNFTKGISKSFHSSNGTINWSTGASLSFAVTKNNYGLSLVLEYSKTFEGEKKNINYTIQIETVPSNLGKGQVYYFVCPFTFKRCRIIYMGYGSQYFKSRKAYRHRLYYPSQLSSHLDSYNNRYWSLESTLEKLYTKHPKRHYKGKITHAQKRIRDLQNKRHYYDQMRWTTLPKFILRKLMGTV